MRRYFEWSEPGGRSALVSRRADVTETDDVVTGGNARNRTPSPEDEASAVLWRVGLCSDGARTQVRQPWHPPPRRARSD